MNKIRKALAIMVMVMMLTMMIPSTTYAFSVKAPSTGEETVKTLADGTEVQYYAETDGTIHWDLYYSKSKMIQKNGENVYRIDFTPIDAINNKFADKGAYMEFTNIVKTGQVGNNKLLYADKPVIVNFNLTEFTCIKIIDEYTNYSIVNGQLMYVKSSDLINGKQETYYNSVLEDYTNQSGTYALKPGLYYVREATQNGQGYPVFVYVAENADELKTEKITNKTAVPNTAKVKVNGKSYNAPAYLINGNNYMKLRDVAYMVNKTEAQFNVVYNEYYRTISMMSWDTPGNDVVESAYVPVGNEMTPVKAGTKVATPSTMAMNLNYYTNFYPMAYNIDGSTYVRLKDIGDIADFNVSWEEATKTVIIDTTKDYVK